MISALTVRRAPQKAGSVAHYNLAMVYWRLRRYDRALEQGRIAEHAGVRQAGAVIRTLSPALSPKVAP
jgi:hypothetical protein